MSYLYSSRRLKPVRKQQKAKTTAPLWCGVDMGRQFVFLAQTQDTLSGWVLREFPELSNLPSALGKAVQSDGENSPKKNSKEV